jgi:hypothetical protein
MFVETIWIFAVAAVGGAPARLCIDHSIRRRAKHAEKRLRMHCACANLNVIRLLEDASPLYPILFKL